MDEPRKGLDRETSRDLNKAVNMGIASLVGAIIPIIGLLLAIIALVMGSGVPSNKYTEGKKRTINTIAIIGIVLSLLAGVGYYAFYHNAQKQAEADRQAQAQQVQKEQQAQADAKSAREFQLSTCLQQAEDAYWAYVKVNATSAKPQADGTTLYQAYQPVWDTADSNRTTAKNECYRRYPAL